MWCESANVLKHFRTSHFCIWCPCTKSGNVRMCHHVICFWCSSTFEFVAQALSHFRTSTSHFGFCGDTHLLEVAMASHDHWSWPASRRASWKWVAEVAVTSQQTSCCHLMWVINMLPAVTSYHLKEQANTTRGCMESGNVQLLPIAINHQQRIIASWMRGLQCPVAAAWWVSILNMKVVVVVVS